MQEVKSPKKPFLYYCLIVATIMVLLNSLVFPNVLEHSVKEVDYNTFMKGLPKEQMVNYVKKIYAPFTDEEISAKMVELLTPKGTRAKVQIVYQPLEGLHEACPQHRGDWYFSGDYPTPGVYQ